MTPFGAKLREFRKARNLTLAEMAKSIGVSSAYLSALEHGKRGRPSWHLVQGIISYLNIIWDEAEDLVRLSRLSHPKVTINTAGLSIAGTVSMGSMPEGVAFSRAEMNQLLDLADKGIRELLQAQRHHQHPRGIARAAFRDMVSYGNERVQGGKKVLDFQGNQFTLADLACELLLVERCRISKSLSRARRSASLSSSSSVAVMVSRSVSPMETRSRSRLAAAARAVAMAPAMARALCCR